jgi:hypothetical protein
MMFTLIPSSVFAIGENNAPTANLDTHLNEIRESFFDTVAKETIGLEIIDIDMSNIIHEPQVYIEPEPPSLFAPFSAPLWQCRTVQCK